MKASIGVIGLAVMGENLVLNMERNGFTVAVYNRTAARVDQFAGTRAQGKKIIPAHSLEDLVAAVERPRKIMMMIKAGTPVDDTIHALIPLMDKGDVIIDGGNSNFEDTERRTKEVEAAGLLYIGTGVSGGEEGALNGPSIMPGGSAEAWPLVKPVFQAIAAKVGNAFPCCNWIGKGGAGHFVKMVHNGIEYGDMQLICEVYDIMRKYLLLDSGRIGQIFTEWNTGSLSSYLIEITGRILACRESDGGYLVNRILDVAGQKGTGKWTGINALSEGVPLTLITESVFARCLSDEKNEREKASKLLAGPAVGSVPESESGKILSDLHDALYAAKIISYAQGFELIVKAGKTYSWDLDPGNIAMLWRGGCIIRSVFLEKINDAYTQNPELENLVLAPYFSGILNSSLGSLRTVVSAAVSAGIPVPSLAAAVTWLDGYRSNSLPVNLLQAQRDYFGAHTYERTDRERGQFFHTDWTGHGGDTASTTYSV